MTLKSNETMSAKYDTETKSLVVKFNGGQKWIPSWDFAESIKKPLIEAIKENDISTVVLDLENLTTISSEWIWLLLWPRKYLKEKGVENAKVIITNANKSVLNVLKIVQLDSILDIRKESTKDILETLQNKAE